MAIEDFFNHRCDIYHMKVESKSPGYALPGAPEMSYAEVPDIAGCCCHFGVKSGNVAVVQLEPQANIEANIKLTLPANTDICINDKIVDCETGLAYMAQVPRNIHGHHKSVMITLRDKEKFL